MNTPKIFQHEFYCEFIPNSPLLGLNCMRFEMMDQKDIYRPALRIELGFVIIKFSYTHVVYEK